MGFLNISKAFDEYYETDETTDMVIKRDYYNTTALSGIYPVMKGKYKFLTILLMLMYFSANLFHIIIIFISFPVYLKYNFTLMTYTIQIFFLIQLCMVFTVGFNVKRMEFRILHREMVGEVYDYGETIMDIMDRLRDEMWKERRYLFVLPIVLIIVGSNVMFIAPVVDRLYGTVGFNVTEYSVNMDVPVPGVYPIATDTPYAFYILSCFQCITAMFVVSSVGSASIIFMSMFQNFALHLKFLNFAVNNLETRAEEEFVRLYGNVLKNGKATKYQDKRFQMCYAGCLKKCIRHHQLILRWSNCLNSMFSVPLGLSYGTGTVVIALSLLSVKTGTSLPGTAVTSSMMCLLEVGFMALLSVLGQKVVDLSEDLRMSMYSVKWYFCNESTKLSMRIFQEMSLRPLQLSGFGLVKADLDTFANVMNSAYSYYNLIMAF